MGISIRSVRSDAYVLLLDRSSDALRVAATNAQRLEQTVFLLQADGMQPFAPPQTFDLVVSNPPYIATAEIEHLSSEVLCEPRLALDGGTDGLTVIRGIVQNARELLRPGGHLALEVGSTQAQVVASLLGSSGFDSIQVHPDGAGIERVVLGRRAP